ncbi:hypothetical protein SRHO_G00057190 [Serrasalmus rhombeus]
MFRPIAINIKKAEQKRQLYGTTSSGGGTPLTPDSSLRRRVKWILARWSRVYRGAPQRRSAEFEGLSLT